MIWRPTPGVARHAVCPTVRAVAVKAKEAVLQTLECLVLLSCRALQLAATAVVAEPPRTLLQKLVLNVKVRGYRCGRERALHLLLSAE